MKLERLIELVKHLIVQKKKKTAFIQKVYTENPYSSYSTPSMTFRFSRALYNSATNLTEVHTRHKRLLLSSETCYPRYSCFNQNSQQCLYCSSGFLNVLLHAFYSRTPADAKGHCGEGTLIRVALM